MRVGIVGAGLIGNKRAEAIRALGAGDVAAVCDVDVSKAKDLAARFGAEAVSDWSLITGNGRLDAVIVATPNAFSKDIVVAALEKGKHVLCEKPLGRNATEAETIYRAAKKALKVLKTGFNHRHHPAVWKAKELVAAGGLGELYYVRCVYGHGGRPGYENEWRASREICGGGELLDQGVHVVDLFRWFLGDFVEASGQVLTCYWPMEVEDNAFAIFKTARGRIAQMHTSWTQWKNKFLFEVFGEKGYAIIDGLGGSYGTEKLIVGKRKIQPEETAASLNAKPKYIGGAPEEEIVEFPGPDISWAEEWKEFVSAVEDNRDSIGSGRDGWMANLMIDAVYESARSGRPARIPAGN
jgi:predicted dehydrogenase